MLKCTVYHQGKAIYQRDFTKDEGHEVVSAVAKHFTRFYEQYVSEEDKIEGEVEYCIEWIFYEFLGATEYDEPVNWTFPKYDFKILIEVMV